MLIQLDDHRKKPRKPMIAVIDPNPAILELFKKIGVQATFRTIEGAEKAIRSGLKVEFLAVDLSEVDEDSRLNFVDWITRKGIDVILTGHNDSELFSSRIYKKDPICCVNKPALTIMLLCKDFENQLGGTKNENLSNDRLSNLANRVSPTVQQWRKQREWRKQRPEK